MALPIADESLQCLHLFDDEFYLAVPPEHQLASCASVSHQCLDAYSVLLLEEGHCLRDQALDVCHKHSLDEDSSFRATSLETLRQMVKCGTGITLMPSIAMQTAEEDICYIPFAAPAPHRSIGLVWRKTSSRGQLMARLSTMFTEVGTRAGRSGE